MAFIEAPTNFYLGRAFDGQSGHLGDDVVYYDSRDLTTHAVVVGMTGSGKTGLCITMLEEAIIDNIPAIVIDPKGDITNLLLTFPDLKPEDFKPWIHADEARRAGMDLDTYATDVANRWRAGLGKWGVSNTRLEVLKRIAKYSIYTPGSDAGLPISILASLRAPRQWQGQEEAIRERINGITTALLALTGMNAQPVKDKEHVLVSNILEFNWQQGRDLTLEDIIMQIQQPLFDKLGVMPVDQYMSEKQRYKLAMEMNNIIASPSFQTWMQGEPMDIQRLLYQPNGRPKVSVFYTAHLNEQERMFITTLILESMLGWMRTLSGTTSLRAILYIDEMFGYFPPYPKNPPTKDPIMRLLKQARAFGVGLVMATQNPGDLDYKGLTNTGTWFIGRLQSSNDLKKVMAGLQEMATTDEELDLNDVEQMIADIKPRVFLMRNVHNAGGSLLLHTRWSMNYLAGPLTRQQIGYMMQGQKQELYAQIQQQAYYGQQQQPLQQNWTQPHQAGAFGGQNAYPPPPHNYETGQQGVYPPPPQNYDAGQQSTFPPPPPSFGAQNAPLPNNFAIQQAQPNMPAPPVGSSQPIRATGNAPAGFIAAQPPVSSAIQQYFLPTTLTSQQALQNWQQSAGGQVGQVTQTVMAYKPVLFAQSSVRYTQKSAQIYTAREYAFHVPDLEAMGLVHWEEYQAPVVQKQQIAGQPFEQAIFEELPLGLTDEKRMKALQKELVDMMYNTARLVIPHHPKFKLYGDPDRDISEFQAQVYQIAREKRDDEIDKLQIKYGNMMDKLEDRLRRKERELDAEKLEIKDRKREQLYTTGEAILSIFKGRTNYTLSRMSRASRYKRQTEVDIDESREVIDELQQEMYDIEGRYEQELHAVNDKWGEIANDIQEFTITPYKKDIHVEMYGIGWIPHYYLIMNGQPVLVSAFA